jgi:dTDP-glucose pyrophosphorylase
MEIIVPAAGLSVRFPNVLPKYVLRANDGELMIEKALKNFIGKNKITIGILEKHDHQYGVKEILKETFGNKVSIISLSEGTNGPAETVYRILNEINIEKEIFIKDCDSFFEHSVESGNYVCFSDLSASTRRKFSKSFIAHDEKGFVKTVEEKKVISNKFSVGGYKFYSSVLFENVYEKTRNKVGEIFVSDIIRGCIKQGENFKSVGVQNYVDVGTLEQWTEYNNL